MTANLALALLLTSAAPPDLGAIWKDLTQNDDEGSKKAWQGMQAMIQSPQLAVPFLKERVKPAAALPSPAPPAATTLKRPVLRLPASRQKCG
jgi:hypothetical protein